MSTDTFVFSDGSEAGGIAAGLCTLEDVKSRGQFSATSDDPKIQVLIDALPRVLMTRYSREFLGLSDGKRYFEVRGPLVNFGLNDLRAATTVTLHPSETPIVLTQDAGYTLRPFGGDPLTSTYWGLLLSGDSGLLDSAFYSTFGFAQLEVDGDWGIWAGAGIDVPEDIVEASVETVLAWMDKEANEISGIDSTDPLRRALAAPMSWDIPFSAHRKFAPYSRNLGVF